PWAMIRRSSADQAIHFPPSSTGTGSRRGRLVSREGDIIEVYSIKAMLRQTDSDRQVFVAAGACRGLRMSDYGRKMAGLVKLGYCHSVFALILGRLACDDIASRYFAWLF